MTFPPFEPSLPEPDVRPEPEEDVPNPDTPQDDPDVDPNLPPGRTPFPDDMPDNIIIPPI